MGDEQNFPRSVDRFDGDKMLRTIIQLINSSEAAMEIGLIVTVPGGTISGLATSSKKWLEMWYEELQKSGPGASGFGSGLQIATAELGSHILDDELPGIDPAARIHLKDAVIHAGDTTIPNLLMRVRLDSVTSWSLGAPKSEDGTAD